MKKKELIELVNDICNEYEDIIHDLQSSVDQLKKLRNKLDNLPTDEAEIDDDENGD